MSLACTEAELKQLLKDVVFTRNFGFVLHEIADGQCSIDVPFQHAFERPGGIVSGQVFMAAADVAMWLAIKTHLGLTDSSVTAEMKTNFLGSAKGRGLSLRRKSAEVRSPLDIRSGRVRGQPRQATHTPHGHIHSSRTIADYFRPSNRRSNLRSLLSH